MPQQNSELMAIKRILGENINKNFVQRIVYPNQSPKLDNKDGTVSTHSMAWGEADGRYLVYPTVVQGDGQLVRLEDNQAFQHAARSGEFIEVDSPAKADWLSKNYKKVWEQ